MRDLNSSGFSLSVINLRLLEGALVFDRGYFLFAELLLLVRVDGASELGKQAFLLSGHLNLNLALIINYKELKMS